MSGLFLFLPCVTPWGWKRREEKKLEDKRQKNKHDKTKRRKGGREGVREGGGERNNPFYFSLLLALI